MKKRTPEELAAELVALENCKSYAPKISEFGNNNHREIDAQIEFLQGEIDTTADEFFELDVDVQNAVNDANDWLSGLTKDAPSTGWDIFKPMPEQA